MKPTILIALDISKKFNFHAGRLKPNNTIKKSLQQKGQYFKAERHGSPFLKLFLNLLNKFR